LYQQMLEDAVADLRENGEGEGVDRGWSPAINVGAAVLIPESYVPDLNVRLSLYRRLSDAEQSQDREALAAELIDRFGPLPDEAKQLLRIVEIKANCKTACIERIDIGPKGAVLTLRDNRFPNPAGLIGLIQKNHAFWKIRPDQKVVVTGDWPKPEDRLKVAEKITADLARVAGAA
ncbi:MAG: transcription-repair coupling factor, partial [Brevundimonas sp.]